MSPSLTRFTLSFLIIIPLLGFESLCAQAKMRDGVAFVTTVEGEASSSLGSNSPQDIELHQTLELSGTSIRTSDKGFAAFALSNGIGICVGPNTELHFERFEQRAFTSEDENHDQEPSVSSVVVTLKSGTIAFAAGKLSPLSKLQVNLPVGSVKSNSFWGVFSFSDETSNLTALDGHLTYTYPAGEEKEFLSAPNSLTVSANDAGLFAAIHSTTMLQAEKRSLAEAAANSSERIAFQIEGDAPAIPKAVRIASPIDNFDSPRPYSYLK